MASLGRHSGKRAEIERSVLGAVEELLSEGASFAELGIERIATRAGISRTAFYFYFRDKRELLVRLTEQVNEQLFHAADAWWSGDGDPAAEIRDALQRVIALYREHWALLRAVVEVATYDEEIGEFWRALVSRFVDATRTRIQSEHDAGRALDVPARPTAFALVWMTERSLYQHLSQREPDDPDELVEALAAIWTRAVYGSA